MRSPVFGLGAAVDLWPKGETVLHIPRVPYLPPGTLREVLAYPAKVESFNAERFAAVLTRLGLERLIPMLDRTRPWLNELSGDEQQAVAFARALLQKPAWVLVDEALELIYEETRRRVMDVLVQDLGAAGIIYIGRTEPRDHFFTRVLHIVREQRGPAASRLAAADVAKAPLATHLS